MASTLFFSLPKSRQVWYAEILKLFSRCLMRTFFFVIECTMVSHAFVYKRVVTWFVHS